MVDAKVAGWREEQREQEREWELVLVLKRQEWEPVLVLERALVLVLERLLLGWKLVLVLEWEEEVQAQGLEEEQWKQEEPVQVLEPK